jgi:alkylated DNA repair protein alkB family protein 1
MYGETEPAAAASERTAFRQAEKKYKLYKPPSTKGRGRSVSLPFPT